MTDLELFHSILDLYKQVTKTGRDWIRQELERYEAADKPLVADQPYQRRTRMTTAEKMAQAKSFADSVQGVTPNANGAGTES